MASTSVRHDRCRFNDKRRIRQFDDPVALSGLAARVRYTGNPAHKQNPGDFGLHPPAGPRDDKTLCDNAGIFSKSKAQRLLQEGIKRGLVSVQDRDGFPQNVWAVTDDGYPLEAQLENRTQGHYHGYPLPMNDPFRTRVLESWSNDVHTI